MKGIFVDLELIEEEKSTVKVNKRNVRSCAEIVKLKGVESQDKSFLKRVLLRGIPGIGKTTAISKIAYDWATSESKSSPPGKDPSSLTEYELVFRIEMKDVEQGDSLVDVIARNLFTSSFKGRSSKISLSKQPIRNIAPRRVRRSRI